VWTLRAATEVEDPVSLRGLLRLANSTEMISDAALEITEGILRDIDTHPVIAESVRESDLAIRRARVEPGSVLDGATVATADEKTSGISIIAIHGSDDRWVFYPDADDRIEANDVLIARGTWIATEDLMDVASA
jgi:uncharacterized protein with PhoU and TrkA domain